MPTFRLVAYDEPRGCAAAYYPETNPLVPLEHTAEGSNQPASKSVIVRLGAPDGGRTGVRQASDANTSRPPAGATSTRTLNLYRADLGHGTSTQRPRCPPSPTLA